MSDEPGGKRRISEEELERILRENEELRRENERLREGKEAAEAKVRKIEEEKKRVEKEFEEYKLRHPETVGVKNGKVYAIKTPAAGDPPASPKGRPGGRPGHKPAFRKTPERVDEEVSLPLLACPRCGGANLSDVQETRNRPVEDIELGRTKVTSYATERKYCRDCRKVVESPVTAAVPGARVGLRAMLVVVYLKVGLRLPVEAIPPLLKRFFGLTVSEGEVSAIIARMAEAFGPFYGKLVEEMRERPARNIDDTEWWVSGLVKYIFAFVTKRETVYHIATKRDHKAMLEVLGEHPKGVDIHDRHSSFKTLAMKTGNRPQQDCWAHIIEDAKELAQFHGDEGKHVHETCKLIYAKGKAFDHKGNDEDIARLSRELRGNLDRPYKSKKCEGFVRNLLRDMDAGELFEFVKNPDVDGTNNAAERALRKAVVARKISGGSRSENGAKNYATLLSVWETLKQRGIDLLAGGPALIQASRG